MTAMRSATGFVVPAGQAVAVNVLAVIVAGFAAFLVLRFVRRLLPRRASECIRAYQVFNTW